MLVPRNTTSTTASTAILEAFTDVDAVDPDVAVDLCDVVGKTDDVDVNVAVKTW